ncbi:MAG: hypothetical protein H0V44_02035 [Planctomycetes bacterium]|nr:hypothetical protein [Planctomycetota bacterium]
MNLLSRILIAIIAALCWGTIGVVHAGDNPDPCYEPWRCKQEPVLSASWSKTTVKVCPGTAGTWTAFVSINQGIRRRCEEELQDVGVKDIAWTWVINGPVSSSGTGNSVTFTPTKCGSYTVKMTVTGKAEDPCDDYLTASTDAYPFTVPCEACSVVAGGATICPGACKNIPIAITNLSPDCTFTYIYEVVAGPGDPVVNAPAGGSVTLGPGATETVMVSVCVDALSPIGVKSLHVNVYGTFDPAKHCETDTAIVVGSDWGIAKKDDASLCPGDRHPTSFSLKNTSDCDVDITWNIAKTAGAPTLSFLPPNGVTRVPAGANVVVPFVIIAGNGSPGGDAVVTITGTSNFGDVKTVKVDVDVFRILGVAHDRPIFSPWKAGSTVTITVTAEGSPKHDLITYELYNIEERRVQWSFATTALSVVAPIEKPGRYRAQVRACEDRQRFTATPNFVCYVLTFVPSSLTLDWDTNGGNDAIARAFRAFERDKNELLEAFDNALDIKEGLEGDLEHAENTLKADRAALDQNVADLERERSAVQSQVSNQEILRDAKTRELEGLQREIASTSDAVDANSARIAVLRRGPQTPQVIAEIAALRDQNRALSTTLARLRDLRREVIASINAVVENIRSLNRVVAGLLDDISALRASIAELTAAISSNLALAAKAAQINRIQQAWRVKALRAAARLRNIPGTKWVPVISFLFDTYTLVTYSQKIADIERELRDLRRLSDAMNGELENLSFHRQDGPLRQRIRVESVPGNVPFFLDERVVVWKTKDDEVCSPKTEEDWDWRHLVLLDDDESVYGRPFATSSGISGGRNFTVYAYANLGTADLIVKDFHRTDMDTARIVVTGLTEEEMITLAKARANREYEFLEKFKANLEVGFAGASLGLALGALVLVLVGSALAAPVAIVGAAVAAIGAIILILFDWLSGSPFDVIEECWPESE